MAQSDSSSSDTNERPIFNYEGENDLKLTKKAKDSPLMIVGLSGCLLACLYGAHKYKHRPSHISTSNFLMQLRVSAQGAVIGCLTLGVAYHLIKRYVLDGSESSEK